MQSPPHSPVPFSLPNYAFNLSFTKTSSSRLFNPKISYLVLYAQQTTKDHIRAEGDFHKEIKKKVVERSSTAEIRPEEQSAKAESCRENLWNKI